MLFPFTYFSVEVVGLANQMSLKLFFTILLMHKGSNPENAIIVVRATTSVATFNISGTTIHSGFGINIGNKMFPLIDRQHTSLGNKLSEIRF